MSTMMGQPAVEYQRRAVLVADDEGAILDLVGRVITRLGLVALKARDGAAALDLAAKHRDSLRCAILDIQMPILNGAEVAHTLRKRLPEHTIVLMSGGFPPSLLNRISQLQISSILHKPFSLHRLHEVLIQATGVAPG